jgi:hypothetical protein
MSMIEIRRSGGRNEDNGAVEAGIMSIGLVVAIAMVIFRCCK